MHGKAVLEKLWGRYNKSSAAKLCARIINFVNLTKQGKDYVESHSTKWAEEMRQLELQGMPLPAMFQCCLFLMSLGPQFNMFTTVAAMGTDADFKLDRLMAKASDFQFPRQA